MFPENSVFIEPSSPLTFLYGRHITKNIMRSESHSETSHQQSRDVSDGS